MTSIARLTSCIVKPRGAWDSLIAPFDIVYALVNEDGLTQKQLCELGFSSKQTVHSSIKRMVDKGVVELRGDTPRTQRVYLTGYGRKQYEARIQAVLAASMKPSQSSPMKSSANLPAP